MSETPLEERMGSLREKWTGEKPAGATKEDKPKKKKLIAEPSAEEPVSTDAETVENQDAETGEAEAADETVDNGDETVTETVEELPEQVEGFRPQLERGEEIIISLPRMSCYRCTLLNPTFPQKVGDFFADAKRQPPKEVASAKIGKSFSCYDTPGCPAVSMKLVFDPFTDEVIQAAIDDFLSNANPQALSALYDEAKSQSQALFEKVNTRTQEMLAKRLATA